MEALAIICVIVLVAIIFFIRLAINRAVNKVGNSVERKIRSGTAAKEDGLKQSVIFFQTAAPLNAIRQAVSQHVIIKSSLMSGRMKTTHDSEWGVAWEVGSVDLGEGFQSQLTYQAKGYEVIGTYRITKIGRKGGVSEFTKQMERQRDEVIAAFRSIDPNVRITAGHQDMNSKMDWF